MRHGDEPPWFESKASLKACRFPSGIPECYPTASGIRMDATLFTPILCLLFAENLHKHTRDCWIRLRITDTLAFTQSVGGNGIGIGGGGGSGGNGGIEPKACLIRSSKSDRPSAHVRFCGEEFTGLPL